MSSWPLSYPSPIPPNTPPLVSLQLDINMYTNDYVLETHYLALIFITKEAA